MKTDLTKKCKCSAACENCKHFGSSFWRTGKCNGCIATIVYRRNYEQVDTGINIKPASVLQHTMEIDGKVYITRLANKGTCEGCYFYTFSGECLADNYTAELKRKCFPAGNSDGLTRIWIKDKE